MGKVFKSIPTYFLIAALTITVGVFVIYQLNVPIPSRVEAATCIEGDANCDGKVEGIDFTIWLTHYNQSTTQGSAFGDFNADSKVDGIDFVIWVQNYGRVAPSPTFTVTPTRIPTITPTPLRTVTPTKTPTPSPTRAPSPTPTNTSGAIYPAQILNLTNWKITLPIGSSGSPTEIKQPQLATYKIDPWFVVASGGGVQFRAPVNGTTTSGSSYPRSELREMTSNGTANASWSSTSGTHTMTIDQKVTALPATKPHIVVGQIHDSADDVSVFRLEGTTLWITNGDTTHGYAVDTNMTLGKRFTVKFEVSGGKIRYYYNGTLLPYTQSKSFSGAYFKAGAYTQANCSNSSPCSSSNYGEAVIYNITLTHQ
jgi:hypothetical protein